MSDLKPCPFCGSEVQFIHNIELETDSIYCAPCHMVVRFTRERIKTKETFGDVMESLSDRWNKRVPYLPPVQPEIIRCKDCKYRGGISGFYCEIVEKMVSLDSFCSWAERRENDN